ncbi:MAG: hypothetical protein AABZ84_05490 [Pseudomonadota bacterium]
MFRMGLLVLIMVLIIHTPESMGALYAYKNYLLGILLSLVIKPWVTDQFD